MFSFFSRIFSGSKKPLVLCIGGATATGKTGFSLELARVLKESGTSVEIISADSRQVYRDIPLFSGVGSEEERERVPHHLVAVEDPKTELSPAWFKDQASALIGEIHARNNVPLVVGGSGFWISSLLFEDDYPKVEPDWNLRQELEDKSPDELYGELEKLDPVRAKNIDRHNPRRLIRSIEIARALGHVPEMSFTPQSTYELGFVYIDMDKEEAKTRIEKNVHTRFEAGLIEEAEKLRATTPLARMKELGLAYKHIEAYWQGAMSKEELVEKTVLEEQRYAKRQRTFFIKLLKNIKGTVFEIQRGEEKKAQEVAQWILSKK